MAKKKTTTTSAFSAAKGTAKEKTEATDEVMASGVEGKMSQDKPMPDVEENTEEMTAPQTTADESNVEESEESPLEISDEEVEELIDSCEDEVMRDALAALLARVHAEDKKNAELLEMVQRQAAEFANFRKRTESDKSLWRSSAEEGVLLNILPILDSYENALAGEVEDEALKNYLEGFRFIYKQLAQLLERYNISESTAVGDEFDPSKHRAMRLLPGEGEVDSVKEIYQKGYSVDGRVLREATVLVEKKKEKEEKK